MGLFQSVKSILKNASTIASITASSIARTAATKVQSEITARRGTVGTVAKDTATKVKTTPPKPPKAPTPHLTVPPTDTSKVMNATTHRKHRARQISNPATTHKKRVVRAGAPKTSEPKESDELQKLKAENAQLREWITKYKERETKLGEGDKYEQRGFDDVSKANLNKAGLTVDATTGGIVDANGKLIAQYAGYTPEEIARFFREHPELADSEDSPGLRAEFEKFFASIPFTADFEPVTGSFL